MLITTLGHRGGNNFFQLPSPSFQAMKPSSPQDTTPFVPLNTPNGLGTMDYFAASHRLEGAQAIGSLQEHGASGIEEALISNLDNQRHTPARSFLDILPNELLSLILEHGYFDYTDGPMPMFPDEHFRSSILQTCHQLRELALNTPSLWSLIQLSPGNVEYQLDLFPQYLGRSGQYPLDVELSCFWDAGVTQSVLDQLIPHSRRWRKLSIVIVDSYSLSLLQNVPVPNLEDLEISFYSHDRRIALPSAFLDNEAPRLVHLCLRNIDLDTLHIPLHNLKTLEIRGYGTWPKILRVREMLEGLTNLEKLVLHVKPTQAIREMQIDEERGKFQVLLAALRTFEVYTSEWLSSSIVTFVRTFACPKLESFVLREGVGSASNNSRTIMSYTTTPYLHKDTDLHHYVAEELCSGHPNRMFVHAARIEAAYQTLSPSILTSLELRKPILPFIATMKATFSELKNLKYLYFLDMDSDTSISRLIDEVGSIPDQDPLLASMASEIVIPSLEIFVLEMAQSQNASIFDPDYTAEFLDIFHLPALRALTLKNVKPYPLRKILCSFSKKSDIYTQLTSLQLIDIKDVIPIDPQNPLTFSFPRLRRLALESVSSNSFIHQLCSLSSGPNAGSLPWPEMEELSICNDRNVSKPLLHRVVSERENMGKPLLKLCLDIHFTSNKESLHWLEEHVNVEDARSGFL